MHYNFGFIRRYQLTQESPDRFELRLEIESGVSARTYGRNMREILRRLKHLFGPDTRIKIRRFERIPAMDSGKFLFAVNRMAHRQDGVGFALDFVREEAAK